MSMFPIASQTVGSGGASSITFSSIPQNFTHLQVRCFARGTTSFSAGLSQYYFFNNDSTSGNYAWHGFYSDGSGSYSGATSSTNELVAQQVFADSSATSGIFGSTVLDILDYTNTNKYKTARLIGGHDNNGSGRVALYSGLWLSTSAINQLQIQTDGNLIQYSRFDLYGIQTA